MFVCCLLFVLCFCCLIFDVCFMCFLLCVFVVCVCCGLFIVFCCCATHMYIPIKNNPLGDVCIPTKNKPLVDTYQNPNRKSQILKSKNPKSNNPKSKIQKYNIRSTKLPKSKIQTSKICCFWCSNSSLMCECSQSLGATRSKSTPPNCPGLEIPRPCAGPSPEISIPPQKNNKNTTNTKHNKQHNKQQQQYILICFKYLFSICFNIFLIYV